MNSVSISCSFVFDLRRMLFLRKDVDPLVEFAALELKFICFVRSIIQLGSLSFCIASPVLADIRRVEFRISFLRHSHRGDHRMSSQRQEKHSETSNHHEASRDRSARFRSSSSLHLCRESV